MNCTWYQIIQSTILKTALIVDYGLIEHCFFGVSESIVIPLSRLDYTHLYRICIHIEMSPMEHYNLYSQDFYESRHSGSTDPLKKFILDLVGIRCYDVGFISDETISEHIILIEQRI